MNNKTRNQRNYRRRKRAKQARRLAVYLDSAGVQPTCEGWNWKEVIRSLTLQYRWLPEEQREQARKQGKERIREKGLRLAAANVLPELPPSPQVPRPTAGSAKLRKKCPHCRSWKFKTIWESAEAAERFCVESGDAGLRAYPCPHGYGWHAGHLRKHAVEEAMFRDPPPEEKKGGTLISVAMETLRQSVWETLSNE